MLPVLMQIQQLMSLRIVLVLALIICLESVNVNLLFFFKVTSAGVAKYINIYIIFYKTIVPRPQVPKEIKIVFF